MDLINIGKVVGTHGIKGEIKILSDFTYKDRAFIKDNSIFIGNYNKKFKINSYRVHKNYDMITLEDFNNINEVLCFKRQDVFIEREKLNLTEDEYIENDLIGLNALYNNKNIGIVSDIYNTGKNYKVIEIKNDNSIKLIPYNKLFIDEINFKEKYIIFNKEGI